MKKFITAGVDEVGRGCLAGPVVSAAVVFKKGVDLKLLQDSKKIPFKKREAISDHIKFHSHYAIGVATVEEILKLNILHASLLSMKRAIKQLAIKPSLTLIDGSFAPVNAVDHLFLATGGHDSWRTQIVNLYFEAGPAPQLKIVAYTEPGVNLDWLELSLPQP